MKFKRTEFPQFSEIGGYDVRKGKYFLAFLNLKKFSTEVKRLSIFVTILLLV